ncbi:MAG TPA: ABC transporter substrate-binding protein [Vicinamibacterales bacterium]|nr:ABC transporter substrate-binding protein [Vicinamibacterales bacterium]
MRFGPRFHAAARMIPVHITRRFVSIRFTVTAGALVLLLPCVAALGACRSASGAGDRSPILRMGVGIGRTVKASAEKSLAELLYLEPLIGRAVDGRPVPHLAESWAWENDDRRVKVRLKSGVRLHSGKLLTAELVARSLNQQVDAAREFSPQAFDTVVGISAHGQDIIVDLSQPNALLLSELLGLRIADPDSEDNGTGPFRIATRTPQTETVRFDDYHDGVSDLGGVRIVTYESQRSAWAALLRSEVDAVQEVSREFVEFLEGSSNVRTYSFLQPFYIPLVFNIRHPVLKNVEVRRALTEALDRKTIVAKAMRGRGQIADGPIWPLHWAFASAPRRYPFDPAHAAARLDRAGFTLTGAASDRKPRTRFSFRCLFWSEDPQFERIALMIQRQLFDIGVDVELEPATLADLGRRLPPGDFDAFLMRTNASRSLDITYRFWRSSEKGNAAMQGSGYTGVDALLDTFKQSTSDEAVRAAVAALSQRFHEDAPAAFIAWTEITRAVSSDFAVPDVGAEDPLAKIWQWRPVREVTRR